MLGNPLSRHIAAFLAIKIALIGLGIWWFVSTLPEPRGAIPAPAAAAPR